MQRKASQEKWPIASELSEVPGEAVASAQREVADSARPATCSTRSQSCRDLRELMKARRHPGPRIPLPEG
jgi:hypothetical protein